MVYYLLFSLILCLYFVVYVYLAILLQGQGPLNTGRGQGHRGVAHHREGQPVPHPEPGIDTEHVIGIQAC